MSKKKRMNDRPFAKSKKKAKQIANGVSDPEFKKIFAERIDLATTKKELDKVLAKMQEYHNFRDVFLANLQNPVKDSQETTDSIPTQKAEKEKGNEKTTDSIQTQKTEVEKLNDQLFAKHKEEAKQQANGVIDPEYRDIFVKKIDLTTTDQKLREAVAEMQRHLNYQALVLIAMHDRLKAPESCLWCK